MSSEAATDSAPERSPECSIIVPVFGNRDTLDALVARLESLNEAVAGGIEAVCVVDGCPQRCEAPLAALLERASFRARLVVLSRNFGAFEAIRQGLKEADGRYFTVMSADLQEPEALFATMFERLRGADPDANPDAGPGNRPDVVVGTRRTRDDPWVSKFFSRLFWALQRRFVQRELPASGIDVFACNRAFRDALIGFEESHSSLVGQVVWLGFEREDLPYDRQRRADGAGSGWSFRRKWRYMLDSLFSFSDLPIRIFTWLGGAGLVLSVALSLVVLAARLGGQIEVPGYTPIVLGILFFSGLNLLGLGIIGSYVWRTYENTKQRPLAVVRAARSFPETRR